MQQQEEVVQLKQEVNTSELSKEELSSSAKMREYRMVKMEHAVSQNEVCTIVLSDSKST